MDINQQAPVTSHQTIFIHSSPETIWHILTDVDAWQSWHPLVSQAKLTGAIAPGSVFRWKSGGITITSTLQVVEPLTHLGWTGKAIGTRAIHTWTLIPQTDGVLVKTNESFDGWLVNLIQKSMTKTLEASLKTWLESLKQKAETYETQNSPRLAAS